jgi:PTS system mannose-specific IIA component
MQGMLVVTHGRLAEELVDSAKTIVGGPVEALEAVSIDWNDDVEEATERIRQAAERVDRGGGVVLLTDMFGGTPTNISLSFLSEGKVEIITGVNLPMLIKYCNLKERDNLRTVADSVKEHGQKGIYVASHVFKQGAS